MGYGGWLAQKKATKNTDVLGVHKKRKEKKYNRTKEEEKLSSYWQAFTNVTPLLYPL